jgi:hypothetical protein
MTLLHAMGTAGSCWRIDAGETPVGKTASERLPGPVGFMEEFA